MTSETQQSNAPVKVLRDRDIKATIWANHGESGEYLTTTFARTYTKDDEPRDTHSFSGRDLLVISELALSAYRWSQHYQSFQPKQQ